MKVALAQINPTVGALGENLDKIVHFHQEALSKGADFTLFSELVLSGYPPEDLLYLSDFLEEIDLQLDLLCKKCPKGTLIIGLPKLEKTKHLYNSAVVISEGSIIGFQSKQLLPEYDVFFEKRYFKKGHPSQIFKIKGKSVAITICEDIWKKHTEEHYFGEDPVKQCARLKPDLILNLSSSPYSEGKLEERFEVCRRVVKETKAIVLYCNQVGGNDELIFDGQSFIMDSQGEILSIANPFKEELLVTDLDEMVYCSLLHRSKEQMLLGALSLGVQDYFFKQGFRQAVIGVSGGIDSAVVACIATKVLGKENVTLLALPTRFSSEGSLSDSRELAENLGCHFQIVSIEENFECFERVLEKLFPQRVFCITDENVQSRLRCMCLMAYSNETGALVLSCSNKSESALGYATLYGDLCGGLAVLGDVTKQQVYALARHLNVSDSLIPNAILNKAPSAELRPNQKDEDSLPPYDVVDRVIELYVEQHISIERIAKLTDISRNMIKEIVGKIHKSEYKRRQAPPVLRVTKKAFSVGRRFPIVQLWNIK